MTQRTPDRRIHHVFLTRDREYHVRHGVCVGVRPRGEEAFVRGHVAVGCPVTGALALDLGALTERKPVVGESLVLSTPAGRLITGRVTQIDRPARGVVVRYPPADDLV